MKLILSRKSKQSHVIKSQFHTGCWTTTLASPKWRQSMAIFLQEPDLGSTMWLALELRRVFSIALTLRFRGFKVIKSCNAPSSDTELPAQRSCWSNLLHRRILHTVYEASWYSSFSFRGMAKCKLIPFFLIFLLNHHSLL